MDGSTTDISNCHCVEDGAYDFTLETRGCKSLVYRDLSKWVNQGSYVTPDIVEIEITFPDFLKVRKVAVSTNAATPIIESEECLVDGIYMFTLISCKAQKFVQYRAVLCQLRCRLGCLRAERPTDTELISEIDLYLQAAEFEAERNNGNQANMFYLRAKKLLDLYECKCSC